MDLARLLGEAGDHAGAIAALQQVLVKEPLHERAHYTIKPTQPADS
jgi:hypothetical protein